MSRPAASIASAALAAAFLLGPSADLAAQSADIPRTPYGRPDLQGNWTNATITPVQRNPGQPAVLTKEQVADIEAGRREFFEENLQPSDPDRGAPPVGGASLGDPLFDAAAGGTGGYNVFFIDPGSRVAVFDGEPRSSLVTNPPNGRIPALTPEAQRRMSELAARRSRFGEYDNPENRPLSERCLTSFGLNMGPPMLPNYFYNNNYTIVQTPDHVMIMTEMVHDVRVIPIGERPDVPDDFRPWFGVSWGRWEGDTLVVETTNIRLDQLQESSYVFPGGSENLKVVERFTRADENTLNYEFTVIDPEWYTAEWGGQIPFERLEGNVYEYACHEANYSLTNVLSGARAEERAAASR
ncbi:MAG TPA: hypothetical protein VFQ22_06235 [Longimicrobiales bacterium]|nr:hypothetical protein [Longimicrobiales bacterium]